VLKADIALEGRHQANGWGTDIHNGQQVYNIDYEYALRSKVLFDPIDGTRFTLIVTIHRPETPWRVGLPFRGG